MAAAEAAAIDAAKAAAIHAPRTIVNKNTIQIPRSGRRYFKGHGSGGGSDPGGDWKAELQDALSGRVLENSGALSGVGCAVALRSRQLGGGEVPRAISATWGAMLQDFAPPPVSSGPRPWQRAKILLK